jgi:hypothetical protein
LSDLGELLAVEAQGDDRLNSFSHLPFGSHSGIMGRVIVQAPQSRNDTATLEGEASPGTAADWAF